jgi:RNA polymerase sigma factor (sigma-70 family)
VPNPRHDPLTADQRALASDPRYHQLAAAIAGRYSRSIPRLADEFHGEAFLALCTAARTFEPGHRVSFRTHAFTRINGAMLDVCRGLSPRGYRRPRRDAGDTPRVGSIEAIKAVDELGRPVFLRDILTSDEDAVGWEAEYQDELAGLLRSLPSRYRDVLGLLYGHAKTAWMKAAAHAVGLSEARVSQIHARALLMISGKETRNDSPPDPRVRPTEGHRRLPADLG